MATNCDKPTALKIEHIHGLSCLKFHIRLCPALSCPALSFVCKIYLFLYVILPLVRSYADNSHTTLSPTTIRTEFFLILPEMVANTSCFDGSISTRNMAFGSDSVTLPFTWKRYRSCQISLKTLRKIPLIIVFKCMQKV